MSPKAASRGLFGWEPHSSWGPEGPLLLAPGMLRTPRPCPEDRRPGQAIRQRCLRAQTEGSTAEALPILQAQPCPFLPIRCRVHSPRASLKGTHIRHKEDLPGRELLWLGLWAEDSPAPSGSLAGFCTCSAGSATLKVSERRVGKMSPPLGICATARGLQEEKREGPRQTPGLCFRERGPLGGQVCFGNGCSNAGGQKVEPTEGVLQTSSITWRAQHSFYSTLAAPECPWKRFCLT